MITASAAVTAATPAAAADWREQVRRFAQEHFHQPAWGYSHSQRDYALARQLAAADRVTLDDDVLFAASYLHDIAAFAPWEKEHVDHADEGARIVDAVLKSTGTRMFLGSCMVVLISRTRPHWWPA